MTKFIYPPDQQGYSFKDGAETISTMLSGGSSRFRLDKIGASYHLNLQWNLDAAGYKYARIFYRTITASGSLPFTIDLFDDYGELREHTVHFVPGTFGLRRQQGLAFYVGCSVEVQPFESALTDADYIYLYNEFGAEYEDFMDQLNTLMNVTLANSLEV